MSFNQINQENMDKIQAKINAKLKSEGLSPAATAEDVKEFEGSNAPGTSPIIPSEVVPAAIPGKRKIAVEDDETGETYDFELNEEDIDGSIRDIILKAKRAEYREGESKAIKDEYLSRKVALDAREKDLGKLLAAATTNSEVSEILELAKTKGSIEEYKRKIIDEHSKYMSMSDDERNVYDSKREKAESLKRERDLQDKLEAQIRRQDDREAGLRRQEKLVMYKSAYSKASFDNSAADQGLDRLNRTIFSNASENLSKMESEGVVLTEAIITREFKKEYNVLSKTVKTPGAKAKLSDMVNDMDDAAGAIQSSGIGKKAGVENRSTTVARWKDMISKGKGVDVLREAQSSQSLMDIYVTEGRSLISGKTNKPAGNNDHIIRKGK